VTNNLIPTINISSIVNKDFNSNKSIETINKIKKACINIGFFQVTGHGINKKNIKNICNVGNNFFNSSENNKKISGIGEIGLDRTYTNSDEEFLKQEQVFRTQLSYAEKFRKPVSIHSRKTLDEIFKILPSYNIPTTLLHWFDGSKKQLQQAMDLDYYVSFGPVTVYSKDKQVLLSKANKDKILVETDGPVRFSRCFENKTAQIDFIPSIVFCASKVLHVNYDELCDVIEQNSKRFLIL